MWASKEDPMAGIPMLTMVTSSCTTPKPRLMAASVRAGFAEPVFGLLSPRDAFSGVELVDTFLLHGFALEIEAEGLRKTQPPSGCHDNRAPGRSFDPAKAEQALLERRPETPCKMRPALAPIQTGAGRESFRRTSRFKCDAEIEEHVAPSIGDLALIGSQQDRILGDASISRGDA